MIELKCERCSNVFQVKEYNERRRKYCGSDECNKEGKRQAMKRYRETPLGKAMVRYQNAKVKRLEREFECHLCKNKFMSIRKKNLCNDCIDKMIKDGYKNPGLSI